MDIYIQDIMVLQLNHLIPHDIIYKCFSYLNVEQIYDLKNIFNIDIYKWCKFSNPKIKIIRAAKCGYIDIIKYRYELGGKSICPYQAIDKAASHNNLEIIKYLHKVVGITKCSKNTIDFVAKKRLS